MAWYDKDQVDCMVGRVMETWERRYDDMLSEDAKAEGWSVVYEPPAAGLRMHSMRLVQLKGEDPKDVKSERTFRLIHEDKPTSLVWEMRVSGKWELGREWHVPVEARLGALMWLNRRDPAIMHELPDATGEWWHGPHEERMLGDYGLTLGILYANWLSAKTIPRRRVLAQMQAVA